jgi:putative transposase
VRAGLVRSPKDYAWSSYRHYAFGETNRLIDDEPEYLALGHNPAQRRLAYRQLFGAPLSAALRIRRPDMVDGAFYGDANWARRRDPCAAGPPT